MLPKTPTTVLMSYWHVWLWTFTAGAAAAHIPQPVASRRVAALERHLGERLFDRSAYRVRLTPFGRDMLLSAKRLVHLADAMEHDAQRAKLRPLLLAVPDTCTTRALAEPDADARVHGIFLEFRPAAPGERAELVRTQDVRAAITAEPEDMAVWTVPLGLAAGGDPQASVIYLDTLRAGRSGRAPRRVWIQQEDDVPHLRDRVLRVRDAVGLPPAQVAVADSLTSAVAALYTSSDLLLCSAAQATELELYWRPIGELDLARGFDIAAALGDDAERIHTRLGSGIVRCLDALVEDES
jgi:DNA-binding transcriptional LysR family regulator